MLLPTLYQNEGEGGNDDLIFSQSLILFLWLMTYAKQKHIHFCVHSTSEQFLIIECVVKD